MGVVKTAEQLKNDANKLFQHGDYQEAIDLYTEALQLQPEKTLKNVLYCNRAMARLKTEDYEGAETDCDKGKGYLCCLCSVFSSRKRWS